MAGPGVRDCQAVEGMGRDGRALGRPGIRDAASATEAREEACMQLIRDSGDVAEGLGPASCEQSHFKPGA